MICALIDLNTVNNEDDAATSSGSPSTSSAASASLESPPTEVCMELWHACAGPLISLPKKGTGVVYFPQGHLEHLPEHPAVAYDLPPHVFCRVIDVQLHADAASDEIYAQVSLVPDQQMDKKWRDGVIGEAEDEDQEGVEKSMTPHMFCKTLTASDTSTHGGFSVPRRAAEDCFPPLDYKQQRPSQELVAKDLHGIEWKFRHIYRGQPRRHLLTTGWSAFVNKKKLVSGDAVLFLRGGDGILRLGIRRAVNIKFGATILPPKSHQFAGSSVAAIVNAISMQTSFSICYNPRARSSEIIIPYHKFSRSILCSLSCGMRFKIRYETDDSSERSGLIVGIGDVDPTRWPGSKWKCLVVRWDDTEGNRLSRVSPWEIELTGSLSAPNNSLLPGSKRSRAGFSASKPDYPLPRDGNEVCNFGEPLRFQKVLQGQEVFSFGTPFFGVEASRLHPTGMRCYPGSRIHPGGSRSPFERTLLDESFQFPKVLQGQETMPILSYGRGGSGADSNQAPGHNAAVNTINGFRVPPNHANCWSSPRNQVYTAPQVMPPSFLPSPMSPPSGLILQQSYSDIAYNNQDKINRWEQDYSGSQIPAVPRPAFVRENDQSSSCRLFGFSLREEKDTAASGAEECRPTVMASSCTKGSDMHVVRDRLLDIAL
ncbi:auxin response factor 3 [Andrographis paniculata]|uniref:auxin response factor 3 n=1 Tax=Andrographis paniculata TaxID=175694 RepID=UPI0021E8E063|nr:auxin response factor 3 [Andrographis paniculata]XP_051125059.1 auxin response factor 3 [Andrographis paniculata]